MSKTRETSQEAVCTDCQRPYSPELERDLGVCCECFRDLAYERVYGPDWRRLLYRQESLLAAARAAEAAFNWAGGTAADYDSLVMTAKEQLRAAIAAAEGGNDV